MNLRRRILSVAVGLTLLAPVVSTPYSAGASRAAVAGPAPVAAPEAGPVTLPGEAPADAPNAQTPEGYERVAETQSMRLSINKSDSKLIVEDKRNGKLWSSNPLTPVSDQKSLLDDAVFLLNFTNARQQMTNLASSASEKPVLAFQNIQNGVRGTYSIEKLKLKITIDYAIKEEPTVDGRRTQPYLEVTIPQNGIEEQGDCTTKTSTTCFKVVSLVLLPLFGAAPVNADGYLMVPDGSGAIVTFKHEHPQYRQRYSAQIYGADAAQTVFTGGGASGGMQSGFGLTRPFMPLWGLKHDDTAYAGIVTKGEFQASINAELAGYITNANRGAAEFTFRRQASIPRRRTLFVNRIEDNLIAGDRQVRYVLLTGADANYTGMATAYRDYLMKDKGVKRLPQEPVRPLVDLFMGITRKAGFREDFVPMTTFDQGITILQGFIDEGLKDFDVHLIGWADDGYRGRWPRRYPAESAVGGNDGLRRIIDFAHKNGIRAYLEDEYLFAYTFSSGGIFGQIPVLRNIWPNWSYGFNSRWDTIRGVNKLPVTFGSGRGGIYLLNPTIARERYAQRDMPKHKSFGADGINVRSIGSFLMSDTNERYPLGRQQVSEEWMKILDLARQQLGYAMVNGANAYVIGHTDRIYDAPVDSLDAFGDMPVPVYHIATQGLVPRTAIRANLRNDPRTEVLRQIEWGLQPSYQLTHQPSSDLIRTNYNQLYSSYYKDWLEPATKEYRQMRDEFGYLNGKFIAAHEIIGDRVNRVTYEDGSQVLVNYNRSPYEGPEGRVDAFGYVLHRPGTR